jgi:hypothetical protein
MLNVIVLNVAMPNVIMPSVVAPLNLFGFDFRTIFIVDQRILSGGNLTNLVSILNSGKYARVMGVLFQASLILDCGMY